MSNKADIQANKNEDKMRLLVSDLNRLLNKVKKGGGAKKIEKQHAKGKLTARERLDKVFDEGCERLEIASFLSRLESLENCSVHKHCSRIFRVDSS